MGEPWHHSAMLTVRSPDAEPERSEAAMRQPSCLTINTSLVGHTYLRLFSRPFHSLAAMRSPSSPEGLPGHRPGCA